ncbi:hypothetical protein ACIPYQ_37685 [Streptomyces sp. NPDC090045]|uniref:hypothetical protein n=1 Tax=Streptomyces sp. NPDC090045 TaxID=3365927 RepID=UPI0037F4683F
MFASYTRALDGLRAQLDRASCTCPAGAHPADLDSEYQVEAGVSMLTEAGRAAFAEDYGLDEEELAAFDCEGFLADLADEALDRLHEAHRELFGGIDVSPLDPRFVRDDGRLDVVAMQEAISRSWEDNTGPVALWSARRWLTGQVRDEERIGLFLCLWMGMAQTYGGLPPSYARDLAAALATNDLDVSCEHPQHPWSSADSTVRSRYRAGSTCTRRTITPTPRARRVLGPRAVGVPGAVRPIGARGAGKPQGVAHHARRRRRGLGGLGGLSGTGLERAPARQGGTSPLQRPCRGRPAPTVTALWSVGGEGAEIDPGLWAQLLGGDPRAILGRLAPAPAPVLVKRQ